MNFFQINNFVVRIARRIFNNKFSGSTECMHFVQYNTRIYPEKIFAAINQLILVSKNISLICNLFHYMDNACPYPSGVIFFNTQLLSHGIGKIETYAGDIRCQTKRVFADDVDSVRAIFFEYFCTISGLDTHTLQKLH